MLKHMTTYLQLRSVHIRPHLYTACCDMINEDDLPAPLHRLLLLEVRLVVQTSHTSANETSIRKAFARSLHGLTRLTISVSAKGMPSRSARRYDT